MTELSDVQESESKMHSGQKARVIEFALYALQQKMEERGPYSFLLAFDMEEDEANEFLEAFRQLRKVYLKQD